MSGTPGIRPTVTIDLDWRSVDPVKDAMLLEELKGYDLEDAEIHVAGLSFYRGYQLLEAVERQSGRRTYALFRTEDARVTIRPLGGVSPVIHSINGEGDELLLTDETVDQYLRFFCWAVHGENGPFYIPTSTDEMLGLIDSSVIEDLRERRASLQESAQTDETTRTLRELERGIDSYDRIINGEVRFSEPAYVDDGEAERLDYPPSDLRRKSHVAYANAVFESWFAIHGTGMIEMVHDEPRLSDLPLRNEKYGEKELFVLTRRIDQLKPRPDIHHYREASGGEARLNEREEMSPSGFWRRLIEGGLVDNAVVNEAVIFDSESSRGLK